MNQALIEVVTKSYDPQFKEDYPPGGSWKDVDRSLLKGPGANIKRIIEPKETDAHYNYYNAVKSEVGELTPGG